MLCIAFDNTCQFDKRSRADVLQQLVGAGALDLWCSLMQCPRQLIEGAFFWNGVLGDSTAASLQHPDALLRRGQRPAHRFLFLSRGSAATVQARSLLSSMSESQRAKNDDAVMRVVSVQSKRVGSDPSRGACLSVQYSAAMT